MNEKIKELGIKAGFEPWGNESWNPGDVFDWSSRYDNELEEFAKLIINHFKATEYMKTLDKYGNVSPTAPDLPGKLKKSKNGEFTLDSTFNTIDGTYKNFKFSKNKKMTNTIPCPFYFLHCIKENINFVAIHAGLHIQIY